MEVLRDAAMQIADTKRHRPCLVGNATRKRHVFKVIYDADGSPDAGRTINLFGASTDSGNGISCNSEHLRCV